jgi:hypothetical protein
MLSIEDRSVEDGGECWVEDASKEFIEEGRLLKKGDWKSTRTYVVIYDIGPVSEQTD